MATFKTLSATLLLREPDENASPLGPVPKGTFFIGEQWGNFVKTLITDISPEEGFIQLIPISAPVRTPEPLLASDFGQFCDLVTQAASRVGVDRDYLMAVAYDGTNNLSPTVLYNAGAAEAGPFQFTEQSWQAALTDVASDRGLNTSDYLDWLQQPVVAALLARAAAEKFKLAFDRMPVFKELYFFQLVGDAALAALRTPDRMCSEVIAGTPAAGTYAAELKAGTSTVKEALAALQMRLEAAYVEALKVIDKQPPENRFMRASVGDPPWMAVAREQIASGVAEDPDNRNIEQIAAYFRNLNAAAGTVVGEAVHWCGAFVGFCVKNCGLSNIPAVTPAAVGTDFWLTWGDDAPSPPPVGSIVVFPGKHVGFLAEGSTGTTLQILGANQSNRISIAPFDSAGAKFRWIRDAPRMQAPPTRPGDAQFVTIAPKIMSRLLDDFAELNEMHAAAILGNLGHEYAGFTSMEEVASVGDGGRTGLGWAQWTNTRRNEFEGFLARQNAKPDDFEANYVFLRHELKNTFHKKAIEAMTKKNDLLGAVAAFEQIFEVAPLDHKHYERRMRYARIAQSAVRTAAFEPRRTTSEPSNTGDIKPVLPRTLNAWIDIETPIERQPFHVEVMIGHVATKTKVSATFAEPDWGSVDRLDLLITLSGLGCDIEPAEHRIALPKIGDSPRVKFTVTADGQGPLQLSIRVYLARQLILLQSQAFTVEVTGTHAEVVIA